ncbi:permease [Seleniivibrio sp.]|uniref:permease n=1 Tax=Seleniivibrio sp. TaxID=2898801 RepID=UPI0025CE4652|nr:permease [Seleniivibrio sp.]MCD8553779.1 permease [Seleniivibrio sp.]
MKEIYKFVSLAALFAVLYFTPFESVSVSSAILEGFYLLSEYVRQHTLTCLIPALFIAGAISVLISQASVIKYFGADAKRVAAYGVASVSGAVLAVCSCTILPLFAGIYKRGAGLGPAIAFVYSGPAINILAIVLTARVLGLEMGLARGILAILFSVIIGVVMAFLFRGEEAERQALAMRDVKAENVLLQILFFVAMTAVLIFATWAKPAVGGTLFAAIYDMKWYLTFLSLCAVILMSFYVLNADQRKLWIEETWGYAKQIIPLLFIGVLIAGFLLGRPGHEGVIPSEYIYMLVGGNGFGATLFASVAGALMYFATLTEIPILQGLMGAGMGKGPALALLLSGPALSLPSMLVIRSVIGLKKTVAYVLLVVIMSCTAGMIYGNM